MTMKISPEDRAVSEAMQALAGSLSSLLEEIAGKPMGFSLIVFNAEAGSRMNYVSNYDRQEVINAMKSLLAGWDAGMPDVPTHEIRG